MNILSAIFAGQTGFLKASSDMAQKASRISELSSSPEAQESAAADLVGMKLDATAARANLASTRIADGLLNELVQIHLKK